METVLLTEATVLTELLANNTTPCISVIVPTHRTLPDRIQDETEINRMLIKARELTWHKFGKSEVSLALINDLFELSKQVNFVENEEGIGFFVAPGIARVVKFPFPVTERVVVGNNFEIRDLLYFSKAQTNYYLLLLSEKKLRLLKGIGHTLQQVEDENFPMDLTDDREYARPYLSSSNSYSLKSTENDQSVGEQQRLTANLKKADQLLIPYLENDVPLIVCGTTKSLSAFKNNTDHAKNIAGEINGSYVNGSPHQLEPVCAAIIKDHYVREEQKLIEQLNEALGQNGAVTGLEQVWKAARESRGRILLVEKGYSRPGFITADGSKIFLRPPQSEHEIISDAVDDVIEEVLKKKGKVVITEDGHLEKFDGIALLLRY
jgi:hypothetical protein